MYYRIVDRKTKSRSDILVRKRFSALQLVTATDTNIYFVSLSGGADLRVELGPRSVHVFIESTGPYHYSIVLYLNIYIYIWVIIY